MNESAISQCFATPVCYNSYMTNITRTDPAPASQQNGAISAPQPNSISPYQLAEPPESIPLASEQVLHIRAWQDPVSDPACHSPRSLYVELFWLPILGPTAIWFMRRASILLEQCPTGYSIPKQHLAQELGLGAGHGPNSPFWRAIQRCCDFNLVYLQNDNTVFVRQRIPALPRRLLKNRLPIRLKLLHANWEKASNGQSETKPSEQSTQPSDQPSPTTNPTEQSTQPSG